MREFPERLLEFVSSSYGDPTRNVTVEGYVGLLREALDRFDDDQIEAARKRVAETFVPTDAERWPLPPRFIEAIEGRRGRGKEQVFNSLVDDATRNRLNADLEKARTWAGEQIAASPVGHEAIREGWVRELASQARQRYVRSVRAGSKPPTIEDIAKGIRAEMRKAASSRMRRADALVVVGHQHAELVDRLTATAPEQPS